MEEVKINRIKAETIYLSHPEASYAIFCYNSIGDLFVNSDWGSYNYAWRHYANDEFRAFLANTNADYVVGKLSINFHSTTGKKMRPHTQKMLTILVHEFIQVLKTLPPEPKVKNSDAVAFHLWSQSGDCTWEMNDEDEWFQPYGDKSIRISTQQLYEDVYLKIDHINQST